MRITSELYVDFLRAAYDRIHANETYEDIGWKLRPIINHLNNNILPISITANFNST